jgi:hypothetical protein
LNIEKSDEPSTGRGGVGPAFDKASANQFQGYAMGSHRLGNQGLPCRANAALTDIVKRVEKGELKPDPRHIGELRMN